MDTLVKHDRVRWYHPGTARRKVVLQEESLEIGLFDFLLLESVSCLSRHKPNVDAFCPKRKMHIAAV
jgi:hypothetical protein